MDKDFRTAVKLSIGLALPAIIATVGGLAWGDIYRDEDKMNPQERGLVK